MSTSTQGQPANRSTLTLKRAEPAPKPHPMARYIGQRVVIQQQRGAARYEGLLVAVEQGVATLEQARIVGTRHTATPADGVVLVSAYGVGHVHLADAVIGGAA